MNNNNLDSIVISSDDFWSEIEVFYSDLTIEPAYYTNNTPHNDGDWNFAGFESTDVEIEYIKLFTSHTNEITIDFSKLREANQERIKKEFLETIDYNIEQNLDYYLLNGCC